MTNHQAQSFICSETWTQPHGHDTADPFSFVLGIRCHLLEIIINKTWSLTTIHQSSVRHSKASGWRRVIAGERRLSQQQSHTKSTAVASVYSLPKGLVSNLTAHAREMMLMKNDRLGSSCNAGSVTHSVGGLRSSNFVSKNCRTSSLWEMWAGSFIRACGKEKGGTNVFLVSWKKKKKQIQKVVCSLV